ncbi:NCA2-domain-containing protein [Phlebopus sp. FC_14]|nr:NCA2-domain-containing protein [Phlebopus sp. FC_14]
MVDVGTSKTLESTSIEYPVLTIGLMSLRFSVHYTKSLVSLAGLQPPPPGHDLHAERSFRDIDATLHPPFTAEAVGSALKVLQDECDTKLQSSRTSPDGAVGELQQTILRKVIFGLYNNALDLFLHEATTAQSDAEWWAEVEQSNQLAALYLLQTLPHRLLKVFRVVAAHDGPLHPSTFSPSIRGVFARRSVWRPNVLMITLFPHLGVGRSLTLVQLSSGTILHGDPRRSAFTIVNLLTDRLRRFTEALRTILYYPLRLSREECRLKRQEHEMIRNERSEVLGKLISLRPRLTRVLEDEHFETPAGSSAPIPGFLAEFSCALGSATTTGKTTEGQGQDVLAQVEELYSTVFFMHEEAHSSYLDVRDLRRPSRLTLLWPRILLVPPLALYSIKTLYASRATLSDLAQGAVETAQNFIKDWLLEPLRGVFRTIRAGGEEGMIVRREAVSADLDSLERMTLSLAQDILHYNQDQLAAFSQQIRLGDLTPVLQIYEEDIKTPVKSAVTGTLLRSLFVQVQKAKVVPKLVCIDSFGLTHDKVDIDQALAGIDRLLKSQELTFAFVGVAPAFAVVYVVGGFLTSLVLGGSGRYGGRHRRLSVWLAMRRIERLLLFQPKSPHRDGVGDRPLDAQPFSDSIPPLTSGLLVLSLTHLRHYALTCLPSRSRLREGFLEDVQDLEDPSLGRWEKLRVLDRMWNSWGHELGWYGLGSGSKR